MKLQIGNTVLTATMEQNSSVTALLKALENGPITVSMQDYASMEKVGPLGFELPRNDKRITTKPGDIILYQGGLLVIYYAPNTWNFTKLGTINNISPSELKQVLNGANVDVVLINE